MHAKIHVCVPLTTCGDQFVFIPQMGTILTDVVACVVCLLITITSLQNG